MDTILFDLDGSLLPMDQDLFVGGYFRELAKKISTLGFKADEAVQAVKHATGMMLKNDGAVTNEDRFWQVFESLMGEGVRKHAGFFDDFYHNEFNRLIISSDPTPLAAKCVQAAIRKGYDAVLATNPIFPRAGTLSRIAWAGLDAGSFKLITTYEDFHYCKPDLRYYLEVLQKVGRLPKDCLMAGNDVAEDMCAEELGMAVFLIDTCLINPTGRDVSAFRKGGLGELTSFIEVLPEAGN